jgi:hypothetical protein
MKVNHFIFVLIVLLNAPVFSQNFNLIIHTLDEGNKTVLPGVMLEIQDKNDLTKIAEISSNENGMAKTILAKGKSYKIYATKAMYETVEHELDATVIRVGADESVLLKFKRLPGNTEESNIYNKQEPVLEKADTLKSNHLMGKDSLDNHQNEEGIESIGLSNTSDMKKVKKEREIVFIEPETKNNSHELPADFSGFSLVIKNSPFYLSNNHGIFVNNKDVYVYKNEDRMILYMTGIFEQFEEAQEYLKEKIRTKYPKAYVVEFENGIMKKNK